MSNILNVSPSPHQQSAETTRKLMMGVVIALAPALAASIWYFGLGAIIVTLVSVVSCVAVEYLIQKFILKTKPSVSDGSAIVTGLLLAFNVPSNLPVHIIIIGAIVSIGIAKMTFGGLGNNPFNPALVGRVFLLISFPVQMTSWPVPSGFNTSYTDAVTGATPLAIMSEGIRNGEAVSTLMEQIPSHMQLFYGYMGGSMGEIAALALILGGLYMIWRKIITWHIPVTILLTVAVFTGILWAADPMKYPDPLFHLLTGGLMLGAIFMATDYVTSPMTAKGKVIYGIGIGVITVLIRNWGAYPEGVSFAILIMNAFVPLLNMYIKPKRFGKEVKHG
ncbi:MAG TPA: RnfABCDGE type electron transport complex subunit D [Bacteroidales bacterium]|jgi:electron transport complex protein RnfD|nr:RnfABCDGE type electron transport complex subunit D [Bacteroidales bacterium]OPZ53774.1 MAG: Electron transport complex protein RnfD [Bacteroidetes bacterium ADurb.BinA012]MBK7731681.1 RnfABCDGE type electron transport complex subunit D [Bacteroidales bacterium]MBP7037104.1 RnfABCDGE type electron transport complex subunit D [Bacteroidales bacterium]MBP8710508.1 RnfABCDGE type electron transport complex subunit D [Bacteroidales bacterium]